MLKRTLVSFSFLSFRAKFFLLTPTVGVSPFSLLFFIPSFASAASADTLLDTVGNAISLAVPIVVGLGVLFFIWGLAFYILSAADEEKKKEGRNIMVWGVVALFVMVSVWGLVNLLQNTLEIKSDSAPPIPGVIGL